MVATVTLGEGASGGLPVAPDLFSRLLLRKLRAASAFAPHRQLTLDSGARRGYAAKYAARVATKLEKVMSS